MDKAVKMGQTSASGGLQVFLGKTLSTIIMAIGTIVLGMLILENDYGLYAVALIPATTILLFQDWGVSYALTRSCAKCRSENKQTELRKIIISGLAFEATTGLILTAIALLTAAFMAAAVFHRPESTFLVALASTTILTTAIGNAPANVFVGFEKMKLSSITLICGAIVQSVIGPLLVFLGYGALGAIIGYVVSSVATATVSLLLLYFIILRKLPASKVNRQELWLTLKPMLRFGVPIALGAIFSGLLGQVVAFMMASYCPDGVIGNYKIASNFSILLTFFSIPITTVLFPAFSKIDPRKEKQLLKTIFASATKYSSFLIVPATMALIVLADSLIRTLYGAKWPDSSLFLSLLIMGNLFSVLGVIGLQSLLNALAETKLIFITNLLSLTIGSILAFMVTPVFGMTGLLIVSFVAGLPSMFLSLFKIWKKYEIKSSLSSSIRILLASTIAAALTLALVNVSNVIPVMKLMLGALVFLATYIIAAPLVGAINSTDIANLRIIFSTTTSSVAKFLDVPLKIMEHVLNFRANPQLTKKQKLASIV